MAITSVPNPPLRSQGKTQAEYSSEFEAFMTAFYQSVIDWNAAATAYQLAVTGTSTTSVLIGTGSKSFTTQLNLGFVVGMTLRIANNSTNYMTGDVTSYNSGTGALVMNITSVVGSGTLASWTISLSATGANTAGAVSFTPAGNIAATNVQTAIQELDTEKLSSAAGAVTGTNLEDIITGATVGSLTAIPVITYDANGRITATSSAVNYPCRAWINFDGTAGTKGSGNVSSITDNGVGDFTINFTSALSDANYAVAAFCNYNSGTKAGLVTGNSTSTKTTTALRIFTVNATSATGVDVTDVSVIIFR